MIDVRRIEARRRNHDALVDAALTEMTERGYREARLEDIADRADLTTGAIYSIFGSKRKLLVAAMERLVAEFHDELAHLEDPRLSLDEVLRGCARTYYRAAAEKHAQERIAFELDIVAQFLREGESLPEALATMPIGADRLSGLLVDRVIRRDGTETRTTAKQAQRLGPALAALLGGLSQRAVLDPAGLDEDLMADAAAALAGLVRAHG